jgi:hypothetical protein
MVYEPKTSFFPWQAEDFERFKDQDQFALWWRMRMGKSKLLIDVAAHRFETGSIDGLLIFAVTTNVLTWLREQLPLHLPERIPVRYARWGALRRADDRERLAAQARPKPGTLDVLVTNHDSAKTADGFKYLTAWLKAHRAMVAVDESSAMKNLKSDRTKKLFKLGKLAKVRAIANGTPATESPLDAYPQVEWLREGATGHYSLPSFRNYYCVQAPMIVNGVRFQRVVGHQRLAELEETLKGIGSRRVPPVNPDIEPTRSRRLVELSPKQRKFYDDLRDLAVAKLGEPGIEVTAPMVLTQLMYLRQALCNVAKPPEEAGGRYIPIDEESDPRMQTLLHVLLEDQTAPALIWCAFTAPLLRIVQHVNEFVGPCELIDGSVSQALRQARIERFQRGELRYLALQYQTGRFGLDLSRAELVVRYNRDWSLETHLQAEARPEGPKRTTPPHYVDLVAEGTVDEAVIEAHDKKSTMASLITGDWRGLFR